MAERKDNHPVSQHYRRDNLGDKILLGLAAVGKNPDSLKPEDLAPVDEFHLGGREATLELARAAEIRSEMRILDVGSGIGGPARTLAATIGCRVTGMDLTEEYCRVANMLSARVGLDDLVRFQQGNALDLPFENESFDLVWTQHTAMNIAEKEKLYCEIRRVLCHGGRLALHDILAGPVEPVHFPVPWARTAEISFLARPEALRALLAKLGYRELSWRDVTGRALENARHRRQQAEQAVGDSGPPPLGAHLLLGEGTHKLFANVTRNLEENRIQVGQGVWERR